MFIGSLACGVLLGLFLWWVAKGGPWGQIVNVELAPSRDVFLTIDLNRADWPEIALIPGIGEKLARRIVQQRDRLGGFHAPEDLLDVPGIGPRKLAEVLPMVAPLGHSRLTRRED